MCIGLMGVGGVYYVTRTTQEQEAAIILPTATPLPPPTFTPTGTATATPTETPLPTETSTQVINNDQGQESAIEEPPPVQETPAEAGTAIPPPTAIVIPNISTPTPSGDSVPTFTPEPQIPGSGGVLSIKGDEVLTWVGLSMLLLLTVGVINHFRVPPKS